jgi:AcrR family transcriptional regulator
MDNLVYRRSAARSYRQETMKRNARAKRSRSSESFGLNLGSRASKRPNLLAGEELPSTPSQERSRLKRAALLRAAVDLFGKNGYEATGIGDIARSAGVAVGGFYQYFDSKRQLLIVLINELLQKLDQVEMQPEAIDLRTAIEKVLSAGLATDLAYAGAYRAWKEAILADAVLARLDDRIREWSTGRLYASLYPLRTLPDARPEADIKLFASVMDTLFWSILGTKIQNHPNLASLIGDIIFRFLFDEPQAGSTPKPRAPDQN